MLPSQVDDHVGRFDRWVDRVIGFVTGRWFFGFCVGLVVTWVPSTLIYGTPTSQALIDTPATIVTLLLLGLLQNSQRRTEDALQHKLNAIADSLAELRETNTKELKQAVGLEDKESAE